MITQDQKTSIFARPFDLRTLGAGFLATSMLALGVAVCTGAHTERSEQLISDKAFGIATGAPAAEQKSAQRG